MQKTLIVFIMMALYATTLKAQEVINRDTNYVVLANGLDTIFCDINTKFMGKKHWFKPVGSNAKYQEITPDKVKGYYIKDSGEFYEAVFTADKKEGFFAFVIEKGKINLFEVRVTLVGMNGIGGMYSSEGITWYISKGSNNAEVLKYNGLTFDKKNKRKTILEEMVADNKEAAERYEKSKKFTFNHIRSIVHFYNTGYWVKNWDFTDYSRFLDKH